MADLTLARVETSNLPTSQKSAIRRLYERARSGGLASAYGKVKSVGHAAGRAARQGGEGAVTGAAIAGLETLQHKLPAKLQNVPVSAVVGVAGLAGSIVLHSEEYSGDLATMGAVGIGIFAHQQTQQFLAKQGAKISGEAADMAPENPGYPFPASNANYPGMNDDIGTDPVVMAARNMTRNMTR